MQAIQEITRTNPSIAGMMEIAQTPPVIQLENIHKTYTMGDVQVHALRGVTLTIREGEFVAIMGASGSGKSTTMNLIGCLDRPTKGTYNLDGQDVSEMSKDERADIRSRKIGFVFQGFNLLSRTSALENVELPMLYAGTSGAQRHQRAMAALSAVGLAGREQNHPNQLSGGQQQRVAIARALINQPAILLADEPTGNLDSKNSAEIMEIIRRLNRADGITVIVVTHDREVAAYADRVVTFRDGVIVSDQRQGQARPADAPAPDAGAARAQPTAAALAVAMSPAERRAEIWTFATMALAAAARALQRNKMR